MKRLSIIPLLLLVLTNVWAQQCTIKGTISDAASGEAIPFATIKIKNTNNGTVSDTDGHYQLQCSQNHTDTLVFSYIGYHQVEKEVKIKQETLLILDIRMTEEVHENSEAVVVGDRNQKVISQEVVSVDVVSARVVPFTAGYYGKKISIRGAREGAKGYYTNGSVTTVAGGTSAYTYTWAAEDRKSRRRHGGLADTTSNEEYKYQVENEFLQAKSTPLSTFSIDVDKASYSNVRRFIMDGSLPPADAVRVEEMVNYFSYDYPQPTGEDPFSIHTEVAPCPWNASHRIVQIGLKGKEMDAQNRPKSNLVFLIDASGSMDEPNKLPLVQSSLQLLVNTLTKDDKISIVTYAGNVGLVLPPTTGDQKDKIMFAINQLSAGGSTAGGEGIQLAYKLAKENFIKDGSNRVILATDGDFNVGVSSEGDLEKLIEQKRGDGIFLTVLGFGTGNYKDSKMELLADKGNGNYAYIDNLLEAQKTLVKEAGGTLYTIAKDVKIQVEFNPAMVESYRLIGYEDRLLADKDFNDDTKDAGEIGAGHTVTALYEVVPAKTTKSAPAQVDPLKYMDVMLSKDAASSGELLTVKFRYKPPQGDKSKLITVALKDSNNSLEQASDNLRFSTAVAGFALLLKDSKYKGNLTYGDVAKLAKGALGVDDGGYRHEFVNLANLAETISAGQSRR